MARRHGQADSTSAVREVTGDPAVLPLYVKAALPALPGVSMLPGIKRSGSSLPTLALARDDVRIDRGHVAAYSRVCGFPVKERLPLTYPHMLAFPLQMTLMTDGAFPFPVLGLVHIENTITAHRAIAPDETLRVLVWAENLRPHPKGRAFDVVSQVHSGDELVWDGTSTYLRRGRSDQTAESGPTFEEVRATGAPWRLPGDLGRRYAAVSGDRNPIHLYALTAKAFGFPRQIAHGMWSKARCVAALEGRLPEAVSVAAAFKKPILLPGRVGFGARPVTKSGGADHDYAFALTDPKSGAPHLLGRTTPG